MEKQVLIEGQSQSTEKKGICKIVIYAYFANGSNKEFEHLLEFETFDESRIDELSARCYSEVISKIETEEVSLMGRSIKYQLPGKGWIDSGLKYAPMLKTTKGWTPIIII